MPEGFLIKQLSLLLISAVKFLVAAPASYLFGFTFMHTFVSIFAGGFMGVLVFFYFGKALIYFFSKEFPLLIRALEQTTGLRFWFYTDVPRKKKIFSRRNRIIVRIRQRLGLSGIVILTPVLFSIPIGTFLTLKYFSKRKGVLAFLSLSVLGWSLLLSLITQLLINQGVNVW